MQIGKEMAIPSILKIGNGALGKIGSYLKTEGLDQVVLFFGNGLIDMFGELVMNSLKEADVNVLEYNELDTVDIDDIITLAFAIPNKAKAVISIGRKPSERIKYLSATCSIFLWCSVVALWRLRIRRGKRSFRMIFIGLAQDRFFVTLSSPVSRQSGVLCSHTIIFMPCGKCSSKKSSGTYES